MASRKARVSYRGRGMASRTARVSDIVDPLHDKVGGYDNNFVNIPDDSLYCPICLFVAREARQHAKCGKLFCNSCLEKYRIKKQDCPWCKRIDAMFFEDNRSNQQINSLLVRCANQEEGCSWEGELRLSTKHASDNCHYRTVECPLECGTSMKWILLAHHQKEECQNRVYECPDCQQEGQYQYMTTEHKEDCPMVLTKCPNPGCEVEICDALIIYHIETECDFTLLECKYRNSGCHETVRRKDLEQHENNDKYHLQILSGTVAGLHNKIDDLSGEVIVLQNKINDLSKVFTKFKIENFSTDKSIYKEVQFEASPGTYNMMAYVQKKTIRDRYNRRRINIAACTDDLYTHILVTNGENDDKLQWPFSGNIRIELLNQKEDKNHYTKITHLHHQDRTSKFSRSLRFAASRGSKFISIQELQNSKEMYYPNNTLYFRISVTIDSFKQWLH